MPVFAAIAAAVALAGPPSATLVAGGDIASCSSNGDEATALLVDAIPGTVATLGDAVYDVGTADAFGRCYAPSWGRFVARTRPAPGNHEYADPGAAGYFAYFGRRAGPTRNGWYAYDLGDWRIYALNSNCAAIGGCATSSPQVRWLRRDLATHRRPCALAYWHHARFSSGLHGSDPVMDTVSRILHAGGADVVLSGHDHLYERFAPQSPSGLRTTPALGMRPFVVGTGGRSHYPVRTRLPASQRVSTSDFGVLQLTLRPRSYTWRFVPVAGSAFTDTGFTNCR